MKGKECLKDAVRYLSLRSRTEAELVKYLARKGHDQQDIDATLVALRAEKLTGDEALAIKWALQLAESGKMGKMMAIHKLMLRGINQKIAQSAADNAWEEFGEEEAASSLLKKAFKREETEEDGARLAAREARYLKSRGFSPSTIAKVLRNVPESYE
jgi:regulatory protein